ncbi:sensor histidine kinase [Glaciihabitans sp. dw_435]|uniref:sensor histidine kinase n=1 Tax=Glaciihabitans sp. dw_435 TaxID=2720081 RepID=UPI001BD44401|nr:ATP-binding protein [Glaciihabitans sp. dw_435]
MAANAADIRTPAPLPAPGKQPRNPISRRQVEAVISRSVAVFGLVFGVQAVPTLLSQLDQSEPAWLYPTLIVFVVTLVAAFLASIFRRAVRFSHGVVSVVYLVALLTWPFFISDLSKVHNENHWLYLMLTVATATAAIGFSTRAAGIYLFSVPIIYGIIRTQPAGGGATVPAAILDVVYSIILGGAVMVIVTMLRQAAASVDRAQATAIDRYGHAVRQHATEIERVQVDSIVHDSVLTTLLSAARAFTPEAKTLAATMAGNAIAQLHDAALVSPDDGTTVRLRDVAGRIRDAAAGMSPPLGLLTRDIGPKSLPVQAGEAVYAAAVQAMVNSLQHAGRPDTVQRWLSIHGVGTAGIQVEVGDTGEGFVLENVPTERLGVRVSIIERVWNAGGYVDIDSVPGEGTIVTIRWPFAEAPDGSPLSGTTEPSPSAPSDATPDDGRGR